MGHHGWREVAIYGAPCEHIRRFVQTMQERFPTMPLTYVDESHDEQAVMHLTRYTVQGNDAQIDVKQAPLAVKQSILRQAALTVVNGNHFPARQQIIVYHPEKEPGLRKRMAQLDHAIAFVGPQADFERLQQEGFDLSRAAHFESMDQPEWNSWWQALSPIPELFPLVLTGGKSMRMGQDKSLMIYQHKAQYLQVFDLFSALNLVTYISCRAEQIPQYDWPAQQIIADRMLEVGPLAGLISAWMKNPEAAWLTVACDMPRLGRESIEQLIAVRSAHSIATSLCIDDQKLPEPMVTIWEPRSYPLVMQAISAGTTCPRKILQTNGAAVVRAHFPEQLSNVNTPEDIAKL